MFDLPYKVYCVTIFQVPTCPLSSLLCSNKDRNYTENQNTVASLQHATQRESNLAFLYSQL